MKIFDTHIHSNFSPDSKASIEQYTIAAREKGIDTITITDHLDIDAPLRESEKENLFIFDPAEREKEIERVERDCNITIYRGIEVGLQPHCMNKIKEFTGKYKFDTVIASLHFIDHEDPYYGDYYIGKSAKEAYGHAYEVMHKAAVQYGDFDILGHFDYIARYSPYEVKDITFREYSDALDPLLKYMAQEGKALEINTKTYRNHKGYTPTLDTGILKRFKELGGECISLGSDSHEDWRLGENFEKFAEIVKNCGFKRLVYFKERKPQFYNID
ncbi:MAG: histidinol-phosphatase HisJ family protein [Bacteroidales bacterium]|nr:histidinol-phosphatase HisJ family protein [Bacteroidales bacterium]